MNVVILGSGKGTNALAVIKASQQNQLANANIVGIFTDNPGSEILKIASENDIVNDFISPGFKKSIIEKNEENNWIQKISDLNPDEQIQSASVFAKFAAFDQAAPYLARLRVHCLGLHDFP